MFGSFVALITLLAFLGAACYRVMEIHFSRKLEKNAQISKTFENKLDSMTKLVRSRQENNEIGPFFREIVEVLLGTKAQKCTGTDIFRQVLLGKGKESLGQWDHVRQADKETFIRLAKMVPGHSGEKKTLTGLLKDLSKKKSSGFMESHLSNEESLAKSGFGFGGGGNVAPETNPVSRARNALDASKPKGSLFDSKSPAGSGNGSRSLWGGSTNNNPAGNPTKKLKKD